MSASADEETAFFALPPATHAGSITSGPENSVWFSGVHTSGFYSPSEGIIGQVTGEGQVNEFVIPPERSVGKIIRGIDGNLWFTERYVNRYAFLVARIGRISPTGEFSEYQLGNRVGHVSSLAVDHGGNLWFTTTYWTHGLRHHAVGRITTSGTITRFPLPQRSQPGEIVAGPDGNLWFTERGGGAPKIGRITRSGRITHFPLRSRNRYPRSITVGPDDNLWFTEGYFTYPHRLGNKVGRITTSGAITEFSVPGRGGTEAITAGPAGNIWFTTRLDARRVAIDSITPAGTVAEPACLKSDCELVPNSLATGSEGALWFAAGKEPHGGGGGSTVMHEVIQIAQEAGFVGRFSPPPHTIATDRG